MPYVLPTPEPRRHWYNDVGELQGKTGNLLLQAMLAQYSAGGGPFAAKMPNPMQGQTQFPGGQVQNPYAHQPQINQQQLGNLQAIANLQRTQALTQNAQQGTPWKSGTPTLSESHKAYLIKRALDGDEEADRILQESGF